MSSEGDVLDEVPPELVRRVEAALAEDRADEVRSLLADLSPAGQASILEQVAEAERDKLVGILNMTALSVVEAQRLAGAARG